MSRFTREEVDARMSEYVEILQAEGITPEQMMEVSKVGVQLGDYVSGKIAELFPMLGGSDKKPNKLCLDVADFLTESLYLVCLQTRYDIERERNV